MEDKLLLPLKLLVAFLFLTSFSFLKIKPWFFLNTCSKQLRKAKEEEETTDIIFIKSVIDSFIQFNSSKFVHSSNEIIKVHQRISTLILYYEKCPYFFWITKLLFPPILCPSALSKVSNWQKKRNFLQYFPDWKAQCISECSSKMHQPEIPQLLNLSIWKVCQRKGAWNLKRK